MLATRLEQINPKAWARIDRDYQRRLSAQTDQAELIRLLQLEYDEAMEKSLRNPRMRAALNEIRVQSSWPEQMHGERNASLYATWLDREARPLETPSDLEEWLTRHVTRIRKREASRRLDNRAVDSLLENLRHILTDARHWFAHLCPQFEIPGGSVASLEQGYELARAFQRAIESVVHPVAV